MMNRNALIAESHREARDVASVRDRILDTATDLFYQEGVRAVGVDLIVERSGVAKTSLYRHFKTKDDLVVAMLERDDAGYWSHWDRVAAEVKDDAEQEIRAQVQWIARDIAEPKYRGCPFINVAIEFPAPDHPARAVAVRHKNELRRRLLALAKRIGVQKPAELTDQLVLVIDGAYVNGQLIRQKGPAHSLVGATLALLTTSCAKARRSPRR
jgi:AcrR family transcriptional regulator